MLHPANRWQYTPCDRPALPHLPGTDPERLLYPDCVLLSGNIPGDAVQRRAACTYLMSIGFKQTSDCQLIDFDCHKRICPVWTLVSQTVVLTLFNAAG